MVTTEIARPGVMSNCRFNADANNGHAFGIFMANIGALRAPAPVNLGVGHQVCTSSNRKRERNHRDVSGIPCKPVAPH